MYQKLVIVGNLGRDPELKYTPSGQAVCNFSVATSERWTGQDGQAQERTTWFRVATWGKLAEVCNQYLSKGRQVLIEGKLAVDSETGGPRIWEDTNGRARASFEINAREVKFLGSRGGNGGSDNGHEEAYQANSITEDEIPF